MKPYCCVECDKGIKQGIAVNNVNPIGVPAKWLCDEHLKAQNERTSQILPT